MTLPKAPYCVVAAEWHEITERNSNRSLAEEIAGMLTKHGWSSEEWQTEVFRRYREHGLEGILDG